MAGRMSVVGCGALGLLAAVWAGSVQAEKPLCVSGIYPHLTMYNLQDECGTGAVVPFADRLWAITYAPHEPMGSTDKLFEITPDLEQIVRPESVGGTPANRMIHRESNQLLIGPYVIDEKRNVRVMKPAVMPGRLTGNARHLSAPADKVYYATMEEGLYEVDVRSLAVNTLIRDGNKKVKERPVGFDQAQNSDLPGYHGKGLCSGFGRVVYANNGDQHPKVMTNPEIPSGALGDWHDGEKDWRLIRRNQFTEVTTRDGIYGNEHPDKNPIWAVGWDFRSLILGVNTNNVWTYFRLPKASHTYDGAHGWHTEWPRIREIDGSDELLMTMHGTFWRFPADFAPGKSAGIAPRSTYLKVVADFCRWGRNLVLACDDSARNEFTNVRKAKGKLQAPAQSQSNLWFIEPAQLGSFGPAIGRGAVWLEDDVKAGEVSDAYLLDGYNRKQLWLTHGAKEPVTFVIEVDREGNGVWTEARRMTVARGEAIKLVEKGAWIRLRSEADVPKVIAFFHYSNTDGRGDAAHPMFDGLAKEEPFSKGLLHINKMNTKAIRIAPDEKTCYELTGDLKLVPVENAAEAAVAVRTAAPIPQNIITADAASLIYEDEKGRWRIPRGKPGMTVAGRICREVCTERDLFNAGGIFYELPAENSGGFIKVRPVATHNRNIHDYASYRGLLVMSGVDAETQNDRIIRSADGKCGVWVGTVDDLWAFGKPRGEGGPWQDTQVKKGKPSDPYLMTGFDQKQLLLVADKVTTVTLELDISGQGTWVAYKQFTLQPGQPATYLFPREFAAYWARVTADADCVATAQFHYR